MLWQLGFTITPEEEADYTKLFAAVHDIAETVEAIEDYHPPTNLKRFSRENFHRPTLAENVLGHA